MQQIGELAKNKLTERKLTSVYELGWPGLERRANIEFMKWMSGNWLPEMNDFKTN